jgi:mono/diheme cytochrome c family protein
MHVVVHPTVLVVAAVLAGSAGAEPMRPDGATVYREQCASCHGERGRSESESARALKVRPLAGDPALARMELGAIVERIRSNAKHRSVGASVDLDDAALSAAAAYVRTLAAQP